jgi:ribosome-associated protein
MRQRPEPEPADAYVFEKPSKTRLKQQAHDLQALGAELVALPRSRLKDVPMPDGLRDAIDQYRRTRSFEGQRRQLQYIGKQMRFADAAPLQAAVDAFKLGSAKDTLALHEAERWRDELVASDEALTRWAAEFPASDLQRLRSLVRAARKDAAAAPEQRNGRGYRELFQFVKPWLADAAGQPAHADDGDDDTDDPQDDD